MKAIIYPIFLSMLLFVGCSSDETIITDSQNETQRPLAPNPKYQAELDQVLMLKVDFLTHAFEGGKMLSYPAGSNTQIISSYDPPSDFGSISLFYGSNSQLLFQGGIIWMGLGQVEFPQGIAAANTFAQSPNPFPMPAASLFEPVMYDLNAYYPDPIPASQIWNAIDNLQIVYQMRMLNPNSTISVFLYTPSVGIGNPEDWDYFVCLRG